MEFALGIVTLLALVMTVAMAVVTWRLVHEERRRSAARLAALETELRRQGVRPRRPVAKTRRSGVPSRPAETPGTMPPLDVSIGPTEPEPDSGGRELFGATATTSGGASRRLVAIGGAALLLVAVVALALFGSADPAPERTIEAAESATAPVELVMLEHERQGSFLAISGVVRAADAPQPLSVLAMLYDDAGVMVASGRAPLDREARGSDGDAPFSISLPANSASRYRISFVSGDLTVPHVDRRTVTENDAPTDSETTAARHTS